MSGINVVELVVFALLFAFVAVMGFMAVPLEVRRHHGSPGRVGSRRPEIRRLDHLVPGRRRPLHRVHVRRRAGAGVRRRRDRLLRAAVHRGAVPDRVPAGAAAVVGVPVARLCHAGRFRPRPVQLATLALLVAITGIVATMPYIALQLVGLEAVLRTMGINGPGSSATCRCSSRSWCWRCTPTSRDCGRRH